MEGGDEVLKTFGVIMAGGKGTRFWPLSTVRKPKQFLSLLPGGTMLQLTAERLASLCPKENILTVTGREYRDLVMEQLPWLPEENLLLEPVGRNTAPCIGWAASVLSRRGHEDGAMIVAPSDHRVEPGHGFTGTAGLALEAAGAGLLVTMGITPGYPATGYGYIRKGEEIFPGVFRVDSFREKPDERRASKYVESGRYLWNSGMFVWKVSSIISAIEEHMPGLFRQLDFLGGTTEPPIERFETLPPVSIDVGVMEKAGNSAVVPASFSWSDIGDWPGAREAGVSRGERMLVDSERVLVFDTTGRLTVVMGLSDVSVISTDEATLVMPDAWAQKLREVSERGSKNRDPGSGGHP